MAQSQYATLCTGLNRSVDFDEVLRKILQNYGLKEWELVQVLQPRNDAFYHLVFKAERSLCPSLEPAKHCTQEIVGFKPERHGSVSHMIRQVVPSVARRSQRWPGRLIPTAAGGCADDICAENSLRKDIDYDQA
jgi:hypothetical protein